MAKATIYIETSIVSYLVARPSRDLIVAAHQQLTCAWWEVERQKYDLFISEAVLEEARGGDKEFAAKRVALLDGLPLLEVNYEAIHLAGNLISSQAVPRKAAQDALHIAVACVNGMDFLLTWNCRHIANAAMRARIERTCRESGYAAPIICTPEELEG